jgi:hypothetical protein
MSAPDARCADVDATTLRRQREFVLEDWHLLPNGKFRGVLKNSLVVEFDGHIVGRADPGVVIGPRGSRYLLGVMKSKATADSPDVQVFTTNIVASVLTVALAASLCCAGLKMFTLADANGSHASCSQEHIIHSSLYKLTVQGETLEETTGRTQSTTIRRICTRSPDLNKKAPTMWATDNFAAPEGLDRPSGSDVAMLNVFAFSSCGVMFKWMYRAFQEEYRFMARSRK